MAMKKNSNNGMVEIPEVTLNALKGLLFNSNEGVDLSPIINDLSMGQSNDLVAINVGLAFKGLTPKIDERPRFNKDWSTSYVRYEYKGFSLIEGSVATTATTFNYKDGAFVEGSHRDECFDYSHWIELSTDEQSIQNEILKKFEGPQE